MNYYKYKDYGQKYNQPEYWLKNRDRYEKRYEKEIRPRLHEIQSWLDAGEPISEIIKMLHTSSHTLLVYRYLYHDEIGKMFDEAIFKRKTLEQEVKSNKMKVKKVYRPTSSKETLCWHCYHTVPNRSGTKGCEWSMYDEPVPGWDATETTLSVAKGNETKSYCVHSCPKFRQLIRRKY